MTWWGYVLIGVAACAGAGIGACALMIYLAKGMWQ